MTTLKFILPVFSWTVLAIVACSSTPAGEGQVERTNTDTTYGTSTQQLKSNKIPDSVFQMTNLRHLAIAGMDCDYGDNSNCWGISKMPAQIRNLKELVTLSLTVNAIDTVPAELAELKKLKLIDFSDNNGFTNIDNLSKIPGLQYLYLHGCRLTKLPDDIGNLKNLKALGLVGNNFDKAEQARIRNALPNCIINF